MDSFISVLLSFFFPEKSNDRFQYIINNQPLSYYKTNEDWDNFLASAKKYTANKIHGTRESFWTHSKRRTASGKNGAIIIDIQIARSWKIEKMWEDTREYVVRKPRQQS
jgi:hypothetical protein